MTDTKNVLLRLDPDMAESLRAVAEVEGRTVSDLVREAIAELVDKRRRDKRFLRKLDDNVARHAEVLRALREG
jgi:predicted DNA-binding protein